MDKKDGILVFKTQQNECKIEQNKDFMLKYFCLSVNILLQKKEKKREETRLRHKNIRIYRKKEIKQNKARRKGDSLFSRN